VVSRAAEITFEIAMKDSVDSFPPEDNSVSNFRKRIWGPTFKNSSISRLNGKRSNISNNFGTRFKNDQENSNRTGYSLELKSIIEFRP
jgi:hypothetical protein